MPLPESAPKGFCRQLPSAFRHVQALHTANPHTGPQRPTHEQPMHGWGSGSCARASQRCGPGRARLRARGCPAAAPAHKNLLAHHSTKSAPAIMSGGRQDAMLIKRSHMLSNTQQPTRASKHCLIVKSLDARSLVFICTCLKRCWKQTTHSEPIELCEHQKHNQQAQCPTLAFTPSLTRRPSFFHWM